MSLRSDHRRSKVVRRHALCIAQQRTRSHGLLGSTSRLLHVDWNSSSPHTDRMCARSTPVHRLTRCRYMRYCCHPTHAPAYPLCAAPSDPLARAAFAEMAARRTRVQQKVERGAELDVMTTQRVPRVTMPQYEACAGVHPPCVAVSVCTALPTQYPNGIRRRRQPISGGPMPWRWHSPRVPSTTLPLLGQQAAARRCPLSGLAALADLAAAFVQSLGSAHWRKRPYQPQTSRRQECLRRAPANPHPRLARLPSPTA